MTRYFLRRKLALIMFAVSGACVAASWLWAYVALNSIRQPLIIHFNSESGINKIGTLWDLSQVSVMAAVIVAVNTLVGLELEKRSAFWGKFTAAATLFFAVLIFIGFAVIIGAN